MLQKVLFLSGLLSLRLAGPAAAQRPSLQDPALYAAAQQAAAHPSHLTLNATKLVPYKLSPRVAVFGWFPHWLPDSTYGRYNYSLLSHLAYYGYQATTQGGLLPPTGNPAGLVKAAHQGKAVCKVLLSISYQEPATGSLFDTVRTAKRHALAAAIVAQVAETQADGVNLDFAFVPRPAPKRPSPQAAAKTEASLQTSLEKLRAAQAVIRRDSASLFDIKHQRDLKHFAGPPEAAPAPAPAEEEKAQGKQAAVAQAQSDAATKKQAAALERELASRSAALARKVKNYQKALALYRQAAARFTKEMAPPPAVLQDFVAELVQALRQKNPYYLLTLSIPAVDEAAAYTQLADLAPLVQLFVLKAHDYTAARPDAPGPLAPLQASAQWGAASVASSVQYYLKNGVPPAQLLVTFAQVGKVWSAVPDLPSPAHAKRATPAKPFRYVLNQVWQGWPIGSQRRDPVSGSLYVQFGANPDSAAAGRPQPPMAAWIDDSTAVATKYAWVLRQHLGGVGIWALGAETTSATAWPLVKAGLAQAPRPAPTAHKQPTPPAVAPDRWLTLSPLTHVILFAVALLLSFALVGFGLGTAIHLPRILPFRNRLAITSIALVVSILLLGIYTVLLLQPSIAALLTFGLPLLGLIILGLLYTSFRRPRVLP